MSATNSGGEMQVGLSLNDQMSAGLRAAADNLTVFSGSVERSLAMLGRMGPAAAGIASLGLAMKASVGAAAELQQQTANLNAVLAATPQQMAKITQASMEMSRQTQFTTAQIIQAQAQLAKAGNSPADVGGQARNVLDLASATFSAPTDAANAYIAAMKDFRLTTADSKDTVNTLAQAVDSSTGTLANFQTAFKQIGPTAQASNLSLKDTTVAIADLMQAGMKGDAGTAFKTFLTRIQHETPAAKKAMDDLGLSFYDQQGKMLPLVDIANQLRSATIGLSDEQKNSDLTAIFGTRGVRVADVFANEGAQGMADVAQHMADIGDASDIASKKLDTLQGQGHILASSLNILAVQGGNTLLPMLKGVTEDANAAAKAFSLLNGSVGFLPQLIAGIGALAGEQKINSALMQRSTDRKASQTLADTAPTQHYYDQQAAAYQRDLASYENYQKQKEQFLAEEDVRYQQHVLKVEEMEQAHQARMAQIQAEGAAKLDATIKNPSAPFGNRQAVRAETEAQLAAQQAAFEKQSAYVMGKGPTPVSKPLPIALPVETDLVQAGDLKTVGLIAGLKTKVGGAIAAVGAGLGEIAMPVIIALTVKQMIIDPLFGGVQDAIAKKMLGQSNAGKDSATFTAALGSLYDPAAIHAASADFVQQMQDDIDQIANAQASEHSGVSGWLKDRLGLNAGLDREYAAQMQQAKNAQSQYNSANTATDPQVIDAGAITNLTEQFGTLQQTITLGRTTTDEAKNSLAAYGAQLVSQGANASVVSDNVALLTKNLDDQATAAKVAADAQAEAVAQQYDDMAKLQAMGVSNEDISRGVFGVTGGGDAASKQQQKAAQQDAKDITKAWNDANSAVSKVDITKGIANLIGLADPLHRAVADLEKFGISNAALSSLAATADAFKNIQDAEEQAQASFNGYMLTLNQTDAGIKKLDDVKKAFLSALDAAEQRQARGTANADDLTMIANAPNVINQLNNGVNTLQQHQSKDWIGIGDNVGQLVQSVTDADTKIRQTIDSEGGGKQVALKLIADTKDATDAIQTALGLIPDKKTMTVEVVYTYPNGMPAGPYPVIGGGAASAALSVGGSIPGNGSGLTDYGNQNVMPGGTATPRGNASALLPYKDMIEKAAAAYGVPDWLIGAIIMHESGGQVGAQQQGGLGVGLMQVDLGQHPDMYSHKAELTGTSPADAAFQINTGTKILADMLATRGPVAGIQGYAGPAYQSVAGDLGVPAGLSLPTELEQFYKNPVTNALAYDTAPGGPNGNGTLFPTGSGGPLANGGADVSAATVTSVRQQIVDKALQSVNTDHLAGLCEQFVEETVQSITGRRGATGTNEANATAGFNDAAKAGLVTKDPQKGDLVYYPDASGNGHVAIYAGNGMQVSTSDVGGNLVHIEPVGAKAQYVRVPGLPDDTSGGLGAGTGGASATTGAAGVGAVNTALDNTKKIIVDVSAQAAKVQQQFANMNPQDIAEVNKQFQTTLPLLEKISETGWNKGAGLLTPQDKIDADNAALKQGLDLEVLQAQALDAIRTKSGDLPAIYAKIAQAGGPIGANLVQQLTLYGQQQDALNQVLALTAQKKQAEDGQTLVTEARRVADQADQRAQTQLQWTNQQADEDRQKQETAYQRTTADTRQAITRGQQDDAYQRQLSATARTNTHTQEMRGIQDRIQAENDAYTVTSRQQQDKTRYLQFYGSEQKRILADSLFDQQEAFTKNRNSENAQSQLLTADAKGATTNAGAESFASQNAILKDKMATEDDALKKAEDNNKHLQMLEDRKHAQEQYDLETITLQQQRAHEDALQRLAKESTASDRAFQDESARLSAEDQIRQHGYMLQQRQWADEDKQHQRSYDDQTLQIQDTRKQADISHQKDLWNIQDIRDAEDAAYKAKLAQFDRDIVTQNAIAKARGDELTAAQAVEQQWSNIYAMAGGTASLIANAFGQSAQQSNGNQTYIRTLGGVSSHAGGGAITTPYALVGDGPNGEILPTTELITAPGYNVTSGRSLAAMLRARPTATPQPTGGTTIAITVIQQQGEDGEALAQRVAAILRPQFGAHDVSVRHAAVGGAR
jgi:TP901 family phage tail tape measure protein